MNLIVKMKKAAAIIVAVSTLITSSMPYVNAVTSSGSTGVWPGELGMTESAPFKFDFEAPSVQWMNLIAGETPATFSKDKITYDLVDGVLEVDSSVSDSIASAGQLISNSTVKKLLPNKIIAEGGYLPIEVLDTAAAQKGREIKNGTVVVDKSTGTSFKVVSPTVYTGVFDADENLKNTVKPLEGTYAVTKPALHEIIKDFKMEEDTIHLTRGNISGFAPNIEKNMVIPGSFKTMSFGDSLKDFKYISDDPMIKLQFTNQKLDAKLGSGSPISVMVSGGLGIEDIELTGRYTGYEGYRIAMTLKQESYLVVELDAAVKEEIRIPILGIDVPFGIGRITGGVFAIVGMDGTLRLEIEARDFTSTTLGVRGSTKFYIPTSVHPIFDQEFKSDGDVDLAGDIDGYLKFGPMLEIELFGFDLVGAGVFLGAGVHVQSDGNYLDVELYGIFNVYVALCDEHFNLANYRPTILRRKQADTAGYRIKFLEAFVLPGRVGGTIQTETSFGTEAGENNPDAAKYESAPNIPYRVLVVPKGMSFDANNLASIENPAIRKYPSSGYVMTNGEGEFIQMDDNILFDGDQAYLEFQVNGKSYFSDPVSPTLPFEIIEITDADYFNDFVTGHVQPVRVINWEAAPDDPPEKQYQWTYYKNGPIYVNPYRSYNYNVHVPWGGQARTMTDEYGYFDTRKPMVSIITGKTLPNAYFDVYENQESWGAAGGFDLTLDYHDAISKRRVQYKTRMSMNFTRVIDEVKNSIQSYEENGKIVNSMMYDEYIWIVNPNGTRTVTKDEFSYNMIKFSTQDFHFNDMDYRTEPDAVRNYQWTSGIPGEYELTPVLDESGNKTGTALFSQRVTVEWVWQKHPNPVKITSPDNTKVTASGGSFQVTASGYAPFAYTLIGAPNGIQINKSTGLMTIPAGLPEQTYTFKIHVAEDRSSLIALIKQKDGNDPYDGNDQSLPGEQLFTLIVKDNIATPEPAQTALPSQTAGTTQTPRPSATLHPSPTPGVTRTPLYSETPGTIRTPQPVRIAPDIAAAWHGFRFSKFVYGEDVIIPITATGSAPFMWSILTPATGAQIPSAISIGAESGVLAIRTGIAAGTYSFIIKVQNDVGFDTQECILSVNEPRTAPAIADETHNYQFAKLINGGDLNVPLRASGSTPITWSVVQKSSRYLIPEQVFINPNTGVLTVQEGIQQGTYYFTVKAENDMGSDTQDCTLEVMALNIPSRPPIIRFNSSVLSGSMGSNISLLAAPAVKQANSALLNLTIPQTMEVPKNAVTIRYDDTDDVYTNDRYTLNGALFIHWQSCPGVRINEGGVGTMLLDESPRCDNYHYWKASNPIPQYMKDKIQQSFKEQLSKYQYGDVFLGERLGVNLLKDINNFTVNQITDVTYLEYGSMLNSMKSQKGGSFMVDLNADTGTMVTGKYFTGLQNNKDAQLSFQQAGAAINFHGKDVKTTADSGYDLYDFGYSAEAPHESEMLSAAGAGGQNFTFGFAYHGTLPGIATFNIDTTLAEGTAVNVYRFEEATGGFSLIAKGLNVGSGGTVTYKNNTMSEYLITTKTIYGAQMSDILLIQRSENGSRWLAAGIAVLALALGLAAWILLRKKRQKINMEL